MTTKDCVKKIHGVTLIFGVVAIIISSREIELGLILLPDLEAYINEILNVPKFQKTDCCINEVDCRTMHCFRDGNGS